jgi:hypothetical protein
MVWTAQFLRKKKKAEAEVISFPSSFLLLLSSPLHYSDDPKSNLLQYHKTKKEASKSPTTCGSRPSKIRISCQREFQKI